MQSALPPLAVSKKAIGARFTEAMQYGAELLLLGGASVIVLLASLAVNALNLNSAMCVRTFMQQVSESTLTVVALFSYPHFIWSYRFAYMQGKDFIFKHSLQLIYFPLLLLAVLLASIFLWTTPLSQLPLVGAIENGLKPLGIDLGFSAYAGAGKLLMACMFLLQFIMGGYHFAMQAFGVALTCAEERDYKLDPGQKAALRNSLLALWALNLLSGYSFLSIINHRSLGVKALHFPPVLQTITLVVFALSVFWVCFKVIRPHLIIDRRWPPLSSLVTYAAIVSWLQPFYQPMAFSAWLGPVAHGLQYMYFSGRVEWHNFDARAAKLAERSEALRILYLAILLAVIYVVGLLAFRILPIQMDHHQLVKNVTPNFFFMSTYILMSTHHYIVDTVLWRGGSRIKELSYCPQSEGVGG